MGVKEQDKMYRIQTENNSDNNFKYCKMLTKKKRERKAEYRRKLKLNEKCLNTKS